MPNPSKEHLRPTRQELHKWLIIDGMKVVQVAEQIGVSERHLYRWMRELGIRCGGSRRKGRTGRPCLRLPIRLKTAMRDAGLAPKWGTLADLFDCQSTNARKLIYERKYESVRQFLQAAAVLRLTPRDLLQIIDEAQRGKNNDSSRKDL